jgi:hypothetical protein
MLAARWGSALKPLLPLSGEVAIQSSGNSVSSSSRGWLGSRRVAPPLPAFAARAASAASAHAPAVVAASRAAATNAAHAQRDMDSVHEDAVMWHSLGAPAEELRLEWTLPTGASQARATPPAWAPQLVDTCALGPHAHAIAMWQLGAEELLGCSRACCPPPLFTGQSFRWRQTGDDPLEFTGVVGQRAVRCAA